MRALVCCTLVACSLAASLVAADEAAPSSVLRMAAEVPQGTAWAREIRAFARDVAFTTNGRVAMKWYIGGLTGDDRETAKRIERDQLDGMGAGAWQCERWAPAVSVTRLPGLFRTRDEAKYVTARLRGLFDEQAKKAGFVYLGDAEIGPSQIFLRRPAHRMDELRAVKLWSLDNDVVKLRLLGALGLDLVPLSFEESRAAFEQGRVDGFLAPPTGAVAFQWSTQARWYLPLTTDYIMACLVVSTRAFDRLAFEDQRAVRAAAAKFILRFDEVGENADRELANDLFARQGLRTLPVDDTMRAQFEAAARAAWDKVDEQTIPRALIRQVQAILVAYRAANPNH